jgi:hypothetical protein
MVGGHCLSAFQLHRRRAGFFQKKGLALRNACSGDSS